MKTYKSPADRDAIVAAQAARAEEFNQLRRLGAKAFFYGVYINPEQTTALISTRTSGFNDNPRKGDRVAVALTTGGKRMLTLGQSTGERSGVYSYYEISNVEVLRD